MNDKHVKITHFTIFRHLYCAWNLQKQPVQPEASHLPQVCVFSRFLLMTHVGVDARPTNEQGPTHYYSFCSVWHPMSSTSVTDSVFDMDWSYQGGSGDLREVKREARKQARNQNEQTKEEVKQKNIASFIALFGLVHSFLSWLLGYIYNFNGMDGVTICTNLQTAFLNFSAGIPYRQCHRSSAG